MSRKATAMMRILITSLILMAFGCAKQANQKDQALVLDYADFEPQIIAHEVIGMQWWQWQSHGQPRPAHYDIKVVVYRDVSLQDIQKNYPIRPAKNIDYRYLEYEKAVAYLNEKINENVMLQVTQRLKNTRQQISTILNHYDPYSTNNK